MANLPERNSSNTPLAAAAAAGLVFNAIAGPIGALIGSIAGAALGYWHDYKQNSTKKQSSNEDQIKKTIA
ncbi:hypothetical protein [Dyadobacter luticola]|uniref:Uncharacterized protein n=1 Tax=Dyadobacter luticola TaxID=1979387 RepID=A0A5R9L3X9_9BACT|nr:hypothetical protein [Dyadobacter luticola]TLV03284.1 hypothetical protein FEN17_06645 [Dyadobacter luticola]